MTGYDNPLIGRRAANVLDGWILERILGHGGTATVYEATGAGGERAALKVLHRHLAENVEWRRRFQRESELLRQSAHPGLPRWFASGLAADGAPFMVLELLEGETVSERCARVGGRLAACEVRNCAIEILRVLKDLHQSGIVHRDLKPSNVFACSDGSFKLLDLGIAGVVAPCARPGETRGLLGTPAFMSPEQARGRWSQLDARSDIWSLAATLFTLLTGRHVHAAATEAEQLALAMSSSAPEISSLLPRLDRDLAQAIDRALQYDARRRFDSASAFLEALTQQDQGGARPATHQGEGTLQDDETALEVREKGSRKWSKSSIAAISAAAAACVIFPWTHGADPPRALRGANPLPAAQPTTERVALNTVDSDVRQLSKSAVSSLPSERTVLPVKPTLPQRRVTTASGRLPAPELVPPVATAAAMTVDSRPPEDPDSLQLDPILDHRY